MIDLSLLILERWVKLLPIIPPRLSGGEVGDSEGIFFSACSSEHNNKRKHNFRRIAFTQLFFFLRMYCTDEIPFGKTTFFIGLFIFVFYSVC